MANSTTPQERKAGMKIRRNSYSDIPTTKKRVEIDIDTPIHRIVEKIDATIAEKTLTKKSSLFRQDGRLIVIIEPDSTRETLKIQQVTVDSFPVYISPHIVFYRMRETKKEVKREVCSACPQNIAKAFISADLPSKIPSLKGVVNSPTMREDGSIITKDGYDKESCLFLALSEEFPEVPEKPDLDTAFAALNRLSVVLKDFPFETEADKSVILAAFLTAVIRRSLPSAPAFGITAPTMGTGKSLLTDLISIVMTGKNADSTSLPFSEAETEKRLLTTLLSGSPLLTVDNIEVHIKSAALCTILTQEVYKSRILGVSKEAVVPTNLLTVLNGNNLVIRGDMTTRVILCSLDAGLERPQARKFDINPRKYTREHRAQMVIDALTVIKAYLSQKKRVEIEQFGRFEAWSHFVREPLIWLSCADPLETVKKIEADDPVRQMYTELLGSLSENWPFSQRFKASEAATEPLYGSGYGGYGHSQKAAMRRELYEILKMCVQSPSGINGRTVGQLFKKIENRIFDGMRLVKGGISGGYETWMVEDVDNDDVDEK